LQISATDWADILLAAQRQIAACCPMLVVKQRELKMFSFPMVSGTNQRIAGNATEVRDALPARPLNAPWPMDGLAHLAVALKVMRVSGVCVKGARPDRAQRAARREHRCPALLPHLA